MAYYWTIQPTGTPPRLRGKTPREYEEEVRKIAQESGLTLVKLRFDTEAQIALSVVEGPDEPTGGDGIAAFRRETEGRALETADQLGDEWRSGSSGAEPQAS